MDDPVSLQRITAIVKLYHDGYTHAKIAERMKVSLPTVARDLAEARREWRKRAAEEVGLIKADELEGLRHLEAEAAKQYRLATDAHVQLKWFDKRLQVKAQIARLLGLNAEVTPSGEGNGESNSGDAGLQLAARMAEILDRTIGIIGNGDDSSRDEDEFITAEYIGPVDTSAYRQAASPLLLASMGKNEAVAAAGELAYLVPKKRPGVREK
jgi:DNA-binding transcriptional regulator LsrR (DeoR family)